MFILWIPKLKVGCTPGGVFLFAAAKRLFTSTFTAQTLGFQSQHYRRVGGFAALAPTLAASDWNQPRLPVPAYRSRRAGKKILRIRDGDWKPSSAPWAGKRTGDKGVVG